MKNRLKIAILFSLAVPFISCEKNNGMVYDGDNYINFVKDFDIDSTLFSFAYEAGVEKATVPLSVEIASTVPNSDRYYKVNFIAGESSAKEGIHFEKLEDKIAFRANHDIDTLFIRVNKTVDLDTKAVVAVFEVIENDNFLPGIQKNRKARLYITNQISRPLWWNDWHDSSGLGIYSDKKYRLFISHSGEYDLDYENRDDLLYSDMRALVLKFKKYVIENNITEDDGNPMIIPIRG